MTFIVAYRMITGSARRGVDTATEALDLWHLLRSAGAGAIEVKDHLGKVYTLTDLLMLTSPADAAPKDGHGSSK